MAEIWECDLCGARFQLGEPKPMKGGMGHVIPEEMKKHNDDHEAKGEVLSWTAYTINYKGGIN